MLLTFREILKFQANDNASQTLSGWIAGAEVIALLIGAVDSGIIDALRTANTSQQIAAATGLGKKRIEDVLHALKVHGLVKQQDELFWIAPNLELLTLADAALPLIDVLRATKVRIQKLENIKEAGDLYTTLSADCVLSIAQGIVISALSFARRFMGIGLGQAMPELKKLWQAGAHHLELGCGVGNTLFQILTTYPKVTAVGVEIEAETANEARRRADLLGVTNRVEVRQMDATALEDEAVFDTAQWSQFFFPASCRADVLRALFRAMKPGGFVFMPLMLAISSNIWAYRRDMLQMALRALVSEPYISLVYLKALLYTSPARQRAEKRLASVKRLVHEMWGVPVRTTSELQSEVEDFGFRVLRAIPTPASQFFPNRGLLLAQRP
jgi:ubiquinone/menaquinone biosynthesis C-methylase UbiE